MSFFSFVVVFVGVLGVFCIFGGYNLYIKSGVTSKSMIVGTYVVLNYVIYGEVMMMLREVVSLRFNKF